MAFPKFKFSKTYLPALAGFVLVFSVGLTVVVLQQQQEARSRAANPVTTAVCTATCINPLAMTNIATAALCLTCVNNHQVPCVTFPIVCRGILSLPVCVTLARQCNIQSPDTVPVSSNESTTGKSTGTVSDCTRAGGVCGKTCKSPSKIDYNIKCAGWTSGVRCCKPQCVVNGGTCVSTGSSCPSSKPTVSSDKCSSTSNKCCKPAPAAPQPQSQPQGNNGGGSTSECNRDGCCSDPNKHGYSGGKCQYTDRGLPCAGGYVPTNVWLCPRGNNYRCCKPAPPPPASTKLSIPSLFLHIIGKAGDSVLPGEAGGGNMKPEHETRDVTINISDSGGNAKVTDKKVTLTFDSATGGFKTTAPIDLGNLATAAYKVTIKMPMSLALTLDDVTLTSGQTKDLPTVYLVTGDTNDDNKLDMQDWNMLLDCFSDIENPVACSDNAKKLKADITDDGDVNHPDVNVFIRECKENC